MATRKSKADIQRQYQRLRGEIERRLNDGRISRANRERAYSRFARIEKASKAYINNITNAQRVKGYYEQNNRQYSRNTYMGLANG